MVKSYDKNVMFNNYYATILHYYYSKYELSNNKYIGLFTNLFRKSWLYRIFHLK